MSTGWRNFCPPAGRGNDPIDRLMDRHFKRFPCPARMKAQDRALILVDLAQKSGAGGVVFFMQKFCTPHVADLPVVLEALQTKGVRGIVVEMEETGFKATSRPEKRLLRFRCGNSAKRIHVRA